MKFARELAAKFLLPVTVALTIGIGTWVWGANERLCTVEAEMKAERSEKDSIIKRLDRIQKTCETLIELHLKNGG